MQAFTDEAKLLRRLFSLLLHHDPDVVAGHNILGFDLDVLLAGAKRLVSPFYHVYRFAYSAYTAPLLLHVNGAV